MTYISSHFAQHISSQLKKSLVLVLLFLMFSLQAIAQNEQATNNSQKQLWTVYAGSHPTAQSADRIVATLRASYFDAYKQTNPSSKEYQVYVGCFATSEQAQKIAKFLTNTTPFSAVPTFLADASRAQFCIDTVLGFLLPNIGNQQWGMWASDENQAVFWLELAGQRGYLIYEENNDREQIGTWTLTPTSPLAEDSNLTANTNILFEQWQNQNQKSVLYKPPVDNSLADSSLSSSQSDTNSSDNTITTTVQLPKTFGARNTNKATQTQASYVFTLGEILWQSQDTVIVKQKDEQDIHIVTFKVLSKP